MRLFVGIILWVVLFLVWPVAALVVLVLYPIVWLLTIPLRILKISVNAIFELLAAVLLLPARLLGRRPPHTRPS